MDRLLRGRRVAGGAFAVVLETEEDHGDVVLATALVGGPHERLGRRLERRSGAQQSRQLAVGDHPRETVRAEHVDIAGAGRMGVRVDVDVALRTERARDDRALRVVLGGLWRELARAFELGDERVVLGQLHQLSGTQPVGATVADVTDADGVAVDQRRGQRRAHPAPRLIALGEVVDPPVRLLGYALELLLGRQRRVARVAERLGGDLRGDLAGARATHPVRDREHRRGDHEVVLVRLTLAADVAQPRLFNHPQRHGYSW
jgi:hypothetical protein